MSQVTKERVCSVMAVQATEMLVIDRHLFNLVMDQHPSAPQPTCFDGCVPNKYENPFCHSPVNPQIPILETLISCLSALLLGR
jgi:hypothetical protein